MGGGVLPSESYESGPVDGTLHGRSPGPSVATDIRHSAIALQLAIGLTPSEVAQALGYNRATISQLLATAEMRQRVAETQVLLSNRAAAAIAQVHMRLNRLVTIELSHADPPLNENGEYVPALTSKLSVESRRYLIDKVLATQSRVVTDKTESSLDADVRGVLVESRELLARLNSMAAQRTRDIQTSPHVYEGEAAIPKAIDVADGPRG